MTQEETVKINENGTVDFQMPSDLVDGIDKLIEKHGGTYNDWVILSVIHGFLNWGLYSAAFKLFCEVEFDHSTMVKEAQEHFIRKLKELEKDND